MTIHFGKVIQLFDSLINERLQRRKSLNSGNTDVLDVLLDTSQENPEEIDRVHIERLCLDLFVAGTDTTSSTLEWAMAETLKKPETIKKAKAELEEVIGKGKVLEEADVSRLPYLRCMVKEALRMHPPVPFLIPRRVEEDVESPATLSRRTRKCWGRDFELIPFGAGRRICPGLPLAIRMVPVMLGSLSNSFDWKLEGGIAPKGLNMEEKFGITFQKANPLRAVPTPL
ncbi:unnamed protein product [Fraxinus pennsylvanica]|uniref:Uncharacterized protein n=1 Tax=Fraxinus pennsylvanica TaxID=56036 RepID=A0AAD2DUP0_9LAMI|nr:unnamed protein product [Fraxinus pennsylvanica]